MSGGPTPLRWLKICWLPQMFDDSRSDRLFGLPPGADFARELVAGVCQRMRGRPPEDMASVTLYLNTGRMMRRVRACFDDHGPMILPRLRLVTDLGRDPLAGLPPAVSRLRRRLELSQLVAALAAREPGFAPGTAIHDLSDSLARLLAEMQDEGVDPSALSPALAEDHAEHWDRSLRFLRLIGEFYDHASAPDPESRQRRAIEALARRWAEKPPAGPVIAAGSTGSRGSTALLLRAIARLPQGAVVLPGFDFDMSVGAWESLCSGPTPQEDHPQYRFAALARDLGVPVSGIVPWARETAPDPARNRLVSLSLRPAPVTDRWMAEGAALGDLVAAASHMSLIEAPNPRAEATAIALVLRKAAEDGCRAALVTPDRMLTRQVTAALDRWRIVPDDSAGRPLDMSAPGRLLRQVCDIFRDRVALDGLLALLKHPLVASGADRADHLRFTRELELSLRRHGPAFPAPADLLAWAGARSLPGLGEWAAWLAGCLTGLSPEDRPLLVWIDTIQVTAERLATGPSGQPAGHLWDDEAGAKALAVVEELRRNAPFGGIQSAAQFSDLLGALLAEGKVLKSAEVHPGIAIWGTLEARVMGASLVILAGLNEGVWPGSPPPDPWLSRQMRLRAGLRLPERQIGLSAHDYQQAAGAPEVILSRARRDAEAETVPSRWLARLTNLMAGLPAQNGPDALAAMRARGDAWLSLAAAVEEPGQTPPAARPAPRPPLAARPKELAVTGIRTLIRDPYAIYARYILRLYPLNPLRADADARLRGDALHKIVARFVEAEPDGRPALDRLVVLADETLQATVPWPAARRLWRARLLRIAPAFLAGEARRAERGSPAVIETKGGMELEGLGFRLTARPDRIDRLHDGRVHVYDYKSGKPPSKDQQRAFDKQLLLEAVMAEQGAFREIGPSTVEGVTYIQLGGEGKEQETLLGPETTAEVHSELRQLIAAYGRRSQGYLSRRAVFEARIEGDYDHLARYGEWDMSDPAGPEDVG